jgi:hypothetical protein
MINLTGHAWESLANHSGFKKADTLAAKQKPVHIQKGFNAFSLLHLVSGVYSN